MNRLFFISVLMVVTVFTVALCAGGKNPQWRKPVAPAVTAVTPEPVVTVAEVPDVLEAPVFAYTDLFHQPAPFNDAKENKDDPAYKTYKEGYNHILDGEWALARNNFSTLLSKYPKSEYTDDATYWLAYALKYIDKKKAATAYKNFIAKYPESNYYDDAVADLSQLTSKRRSVSTSNGVWVYDSDNDSSGSSAVTVVGGKGKSWAKGGTFDLGHPVAIPNLDISTRKLNRSLEKLKLTTPGYFRAPRVPRVPRVLSGYYGLTLSDDTLDETTKIKMDALYALGETREDSTSYKTLRDVAVNTKQPRVLRETALDALSEFKKIDVLQDFVHIATNDPDEEIQNSAIYYISDLSGNKDRRVDALIQLFDKLPKSKKEQRENIFYTIADIGNDKAIDFLVSVAKSSNDYELRSQAIYYLGNIGGEKARNALYSILKEN